MTPKGNEAPKPVSAAPKVENKATLPKEKAPSMEKSKSRKGLEMVGGFVVGAAIAIPLCGVIRYK